MVLLSETQGSAIHYFRVLVEKQVLCVHTSAFTKVTGTNCAALLFHSPF